jgi:beta-aspartyl-peptidase (threonine type)
MDGGSAVDAVEAAVRYLEDDPTFDAGIGSVLNAAGELEMDAAIMDGADLSAGGVACLHNIQHPVSLARLVMNKTPHTLLVGPGADDFAAEMGIPTIDTERLLSEEAKQGYRKYHADGVSVTDIINSVAVTARRRLSSARKEAALDTMWPGNASHDTVGAVALDRYGNVACATSTGGITAKRPGRVGDAPIVGAGGYADNAVGAVSCTGHGESISKVCLAHRIITNIRYGMDGLTAAKESLEHMRERVKGCGGAVLITRGGEVAHSFTTERMAWASVVKDVLNYGLEPGEVQTENWTEDSVNILID